MTLRVVVVVDFILFNTILKINYALMISNLKFNTQQMVEIAKFNSRQNMVDVMELCFENLFNIEIIETLRRDHQECWRIGTNNCVMAKG